MNKVKQAAMQDLSVNCAESAQQALAAFQSKRASAIYLKLDPATETLTGQSEEKVSMESIEGHLKPKEPVYVVFVTEVGGQRINLFVHYCPEDAPPRHKMFSAASKGMIAKVVETQGIEISKTLEFNTPGDFNLKNIQDELAPKVSGAKKLLVKPKPQGRGKPVFKGTFTSPKAAEDE